MALLMRRWACTLIATTEYLWYVHLLWQPAIRGSALSSPVFWICFVAVFSELLQTSLSFPLSPLSPHEGSRQGLSLKRWLPVLASAESVCLVMTRRIDAAICQQPTSSSSLVGGARLDTGTTTRQKQKQKHHGYLLPHPLSQADSLPLAGCSSGFALIIGLPLGSSQQLQI